MGTSVSGGDPQQKVLMIDLGAIIQENIPTHDNKKLLTANRGLSYRSATFPGPKDKFPREYAEKSGLRESREYLRTRSI